MAENDLTRVEVTVSGRVQGVSFRYYTLRRAQMLGIEGWVKNMPNGKVKVLIEGHKQKVQQMLDWLKEGPSMANVTNLDYQYGSYKGEFGSFEIKF